MSYQIPVIDFEVVFEHRRDIFSYKQIRSVKVEKKFKILINKMHNFSGCGQILNNYIFKKTLKSLKVG